MAGVGLLSTALAALFLAAPSSSGQQDLLAFHVASEGRDSWSGLLATPSEDGRDGPFATPARAQRAVREALAAGARPVSVTLAEGIYELDEPLVFTHEDCDREGLQVSWKARKGARPILSGGRRITGWRVTDDGRWRVELPEVRDGTWDFAQLWVNGQRRFRRRRSGGQEREENREEVSWNRRRHRRLESGTSVDAPEYAGDRLTLSPRIQAAPACRRGPAKGSLTLGGRGIRGRGLPRNLAAVELDTVTVRESGS